MTDGRRRGKIYQHKRDVILGRLTDLGFRAQASYKAKEGWWTYYPASGGTRFKMYLPSLVDVAEFVRWVRKEDDTFLATLAKSTREPEKPEKAPPPRWRSLRDALREGE